METSIYIAQIVSVCYLVVGFGFLINANYFKKAMDEMATSHIAVYLGGIMGLVAGFVIVSIHNIWVKDWTVLITLIGWIALIKGVLLFLIPKQFMSLSQIIVKKMWFVPMFAIVLGLIFGYFGFYA